MEDIKKLVEDKALECICKLEQVYHQILKLPTIEYRSMGLRAGLAIFSAWKIVLNTDYCRNGHLQEMLNRTVPHEIAHLVAYKVYGVYGRGHKNGWKVVMRHLGVPATRCHNYSTEGIKLRQRRWFYYQCQCRKHIKISSVKHNRIQKGYIYICRYCKSKIVYMGMSVENQ